MEYFSFFYFVKILRNSRKKSLRWKFFLCLNGWGSFKKLLYIHIIYNTYIYYIVFLFNFVIYKDKLQDKYVSRVSSFEMVTKTHTVLSS